MNLLHSFAVAVVSAGVPSRAFTDQPGEASLISDAKRGDLRAFGRLVSMYRRIALKGATRVVGDKHLAEDVVQESIVKALEKLEQFRTGGRFAYWFLTIVRNTAIDLKRELQKREVLSLDVPYDPDNPENPTVSDVPSAAPSPEGEFNRKRVRQGFEDARNLSEREKQVVAMRAEKVKWDDIAQELGMSDEGAQKAYKRAQGKLQSSLQDIAEDFYVSELSCPDHWTLRNLAPTKLTKAQREMHYYWGYLDEAEWNRSKATPWKEPETEE